MYTVEFEHDEICITILDDTAQNEDLIVNSFDDVVFIRQYDPEIKRHQIVQISPQMWEDLICAMDSPEGFFKAI